MMQVPVTWSPDIDYRKRESAPANRERTPVKLSPNSKSQIVLRSTPRKRLMLNDPKEMCFSPEKKKVRRWNLMKYNLDLVYAVLIPRNSRENAFNCGQ